MKKPNMCEQCPTLKSFFCWMPCPAVNEILNRMDKDREMDKSKSEDAQKEA